jgi:hypothetical protein
MMFGIDIFSIQFVFFWAILALVNTGLAQSKNKDGLTWFVVSVIFGPIATLVIVLSKKSEEEI